MKKENVRCWRVGGNDELLITYPEGDKGHRLICCGNCGAVYAVNVIKQLYMEPDLEAYLENIKCLKCALTLAEKWFFYPDTYIKKDGTESAFTRAGIIPDDADSIVEEFYEIFS